MRIDDGKNERENLVVNSDVIKQMRQSALLLLSRREYSRVELEQRLTKIDGAQPYLTQVLEQLRQQGLQSDLRYAQSLLRSRISRGQGPVRIAQELRHKGVDSALKDEVMVACDQDWFELARSVRERRFGLAAPEDRRAQAKQQRFLLYRGFTQDQLRYAMSEPDPD
ncbi:MAG: regulatory protein RecX [Halopseudomonas sp.]